MIKDALDFLASSKTILLWIVIVLVGFLALMITLVVLVAFDVENPYLNEFYNLLTGGGIGGTARNIISDGIMPRVPQAVAANKQPSIAIESPQPMAKKTTEWTPPPALPTKLEG